jgi:hypothetical protein
MGFIWTKQNTAHIARHSIEPWFAEKIFREGSSVTRTDVEFRYFVEATIRGKHYKLVFAVDPEGANIYPITAYQIKKRTI